MMEFIKLSTNRVYLNFKSVFSNLLTAILLFVIPFLFCVSTLIIVPIGYFYGIIMTGSTMLSGFIIYGTVAGSFRRSTLNKNSNLTVGIRWVDNASTIITMVLMSITMMLFITITLEIFAWTGLMLVKLDGIRTSEEHIEILKHLDILNVVYQTVITSLITYSLSYFIQGFFDSDMVFFTFAICMSILLMIFGGTVNSYFNIGKVGPFYKPGDWVVIYKADSLMGDAFYIPSLFFPYYSQSAMLKLNMMSVVFDEGSSAHALWSWTSYNQGWRYSMLWISPYINILIWWAIGFVYKNIIKNWDSFKFAKKNNDDKEQQ